MKNWKQILLRLLHPGKLPSVVIPAFSFFLLAVVFRRGLTMTVLGCFSYVLSFYGLVLFLAEAIPLMINVFRAYRRLRFRRAVSVWNIQLQSTVVHMGYALYNLGCGWLYRSVWLTSNGAYHLTLGLLHLMLSRYARKARAEPDPVLKMRHGWKGFRRCGMWMLVLNLAMSGMVAQMIWVGQEKQYSEITVISIAAYTFYKLTASILQVAKRQGKEDPIHGASRNIDLTAATMSVYSLQDALLQTFGADERFHWMMNLLTGIAVCILTVVGALGMWLHGEKQSAK